MNPTEPLLLNLVLVHPVNPWLTTEVLIRAPSLDAAERCIALVRQRIQDHELN